MPENIIRSERNELFEPNVYIEFIVEVGGNPTTEQLLSAVKKAYANNGTTMSKVMLQSNGTAFYEKMEQTGCKVSVTKKTWQEILFKYEKMPFDLRNGELVRTFIIKNADKTQLFIMAHHLAGDGKSITYFIEDIMNALSGKELEYKELKVLELSEFSKDEQIKKSFRHYIEKRNKKWAKKGKVFGWGDFLKVHKTYWRNHSSKIFHEHFSPIEVENIHNCAKNIGVSVNTYIATAFLEADKTQRQVGTAVDIRRDGDRSMVNRASGISADYGYKPKKSFEENARRLQKKFDKKLNNPKYKNFIVQFVALFTGSLYDSILMYTYGLTNLKMARKMAKTMGYKGRDPIPLGVSNLTKLDISNDYGEYKILDLMFIPPVTSYSDRIIGVVTTDAGMTVTYHMMSNKINENENVFFNRGINHLTLAAGKSEKE